MKIYILKRLTIIITILLIIILSIYGMNYSFKYNNSYKDRIIENINKVKILENGAYNIDSLNGYYTEITIRMDNDSSYTVVYWGDRNSWLWNFKLDHKFNVDIPYNRSLGIDVSKDVELLNKLKSIKN